MNIASNPWSFVQADIVSATPVASPNGFVPQTPGTTILLTTSGAHGFTENQFITAFGDTSGKFQGCYRVLNVPSTTTALLLPLGGVISQQTSTPAASGGGTVALCLWDQWVRAEDMQWEKPAAGETLDIRDRNGNIVWQGSYPAGSSAPNWNRGKLFWIQGITPVSISAGGSGILIVTVN